jgi:hypothetical protein
MNELTVLQRAGLRTQRSSVVLRFLEKNFESLAIIRKGFLSGYVMSTFCDLIHNRL